MKNLNFSLLFKFEICFFFAGLGLFLVPAPLSAQAHAPDFVRMGTQAFHNKQYDMAISYYNSAIDEDMNYWPAYQALGIVYYYKKNYKEAEKNFEKALELNTDNPSLRKFVNGLRAYLHLPALPAPTPTPVFTMPQAVPQ
jgi:tetratricopeptide (TPR) repeat protein